MSPAPASATSPGGNLQPGIAMHHSGAAHRDRLHVKFGTAEQIENAMLPSIDRSESTTTGVLAGGAVDGSSGGTAVVVGAVVVVARVLVVEARVVIIAAAGQGDGRTGRGAAHTTRNE